MQSNPQSTNPPAVDDVLSTRPTLKPSRKSKFTEVIDSYLKTVNTVGENTEADYQAVQAALERMKEYAEEVIVELARAEASCKPSDYTLRWLLVHGATQMKHTSALPFLRSFVLNPIPPEESVTPHSFSTVGEETVLRTTAIEGISYLALQGDERAVEALFEALEISSISIRRATIQALLSIDANLRDRIAEHIPLEFHYLLDVRPMQVTEVPQIENPERHLRSWEEPRDKTRPPDFFAGEISRRDENNSAPNVGGK
jgi:hypothetical protein